MDKTHECPALGIKHHIGLDSQLLQPWSLRLFNLNANPHRRKPSTKMLDSRQDDVRYPPLEPVSSIPISKRELILTSK